MPKTSDMQKRILDFITRQVALQGYPPTVREIGDAVGLRSPSTVHFHLKRMEEAGLIRKGSSKGRAITLVAPEGPRANQIPIVGTVAAGQPILAIEHIEDYLTFATDAPSDEYFALHVQGESMLGAGILPGDLVVVHQQSEVHNGEIVVAMIDDEATVKRYLRKKGDIWLLPENPDFSPINGNRAQILGRVTAVVRRYAG